jgi:GAF domain-containing protein
MKAAGRDVTLLARAAREIHAAASPAEALDVIVANAATTLPGIDHVGISRASADGSLETVAASDELVREFEALERKHGEGPCMYAALEESVLRSVPARFEQRWPAYIADALQLGLKAQIGMRLHTDDHEMAALNLYSTSTEELDPEVEDLAELFAAYAAIALGRSMAEGHLNSALVTRRVIGQATGIIMARFRVTDERAFSYLVRLSNTQNLKLRDVATRIVGEANDEAADRGEKTDEPEALPEP